MEALAAVVDGLRNLLAVTVMANSKAGSPPPKFDPYPRPRTAIDSARLKHKIRAHQTLADRLLRRDQANG